VCKVLVAAHLDPGKGRAVGALEGVDPAVLGRAVGDDLEDAVAAGDADAEAGTLPWVEE
jgi:hypothetical protein